eukprot:TRINITY_DN7511_c0_g1_i3.p1 TRINITY_DN7511_c0_g1~~TRINITY_DN7511_c0_g1_i3.p1  ORF type:complete len:733 (+),score=152.36 TRINITY_DN7511_c0_g1_i3:197-2200(+)
MLAASAAVVELSLAQVLAKKPEKRLQWLQKVMPFVEVGQVKSTAVYDIIAHPKFLDSCLGNEVGEHIRALLLVTSHLFSGRQQRFLKSYCDKIRGLEELGDGGNPSSSEVVAVVGDESAATSMAAVSSLTETAAEQPLVATRKAVPAAAALAVVPVASPASSAVTVAAVAAPTSPPQAANLGAKGRPASATALAVSAAVSNSAVDAEAVKRWIAAKAAAAAAHVTQQVVEPPPPQWQPVVELSASSPVRQSVEAASDTVGIVMASAPSLAASSSATGVETVLFPDRNASNEREGRREDQRPTTTSAVAAALASASANATNSAVAARLANVVASAAATSAECRPPKVSGSSTSFVDAKAAFGTVLGEAGAQEVHQRRRDETREMWLPPAHRSGSSSSGSRSRSRSRKGRRGRVRGEGAGRGSGEGNYSRTRQDLRGNGGEASASVVSEPSVPSSSTSISALTSLASASDPTAGPAATKLKRARRARRRHGSESCDSDDVGTISLSRARARSRSKSNKGKKKLFLEKPPVDKPPPATGAASARQGANERTLIQLSGLTGQQLAPAGLDAGIKQAEFQAAQAAAARRLQHVPTSWAAVRPGDWICAVCAAHNFQSRGRCFRCFQGTAPFTDPNCPVGAVVNFRAGDWICSRCSNHNFSKRESCNKCQAPR